MLDTLLSTIAPHECVACGREGFVLCAYCADGAYESVPSRCFMCFKPTALYSVCASCIELTTVRHVWVGGEYKSVLKQVIHEFKFGTKRAAAKDLVRRLNEVVSDLPDDIIVTHIPTAYTRARTRGFDQAKLLAKGLAHTRGYVFASLLRRQTAVRELGLTRTQRQAAMKNAFVAVSPALVKGSRILLVDDVVTTGATLNEAARVLHELGATQVDAVVAAQTPQQ